MPRRKAKPVPTPNPPPNGPEAPPKETETDETDDAGQTIPLIKGSRSAHTHRKKGEEPPDPAERPHVGTLTANLEAILSNGPDSLAAAHRQYATLSKQHGEIFESQWFLLTPYLQKLESTSPPDNYLANFGPRGNGQQPVSPQIRFNEWQRRTRARVRYALSWRPRFLAMLAITGSQVIASAHARVSYMTVKDHRRADPDFAQQVQEADDHATELLKDRAMQLAMEGNMEAIYYMGVPVGYQRKFDSRLIVELLRARSPEKFKTPGQAPIVLNDNRQVFVMDTATLSELQQLRRDALTAERAMARPVVDSP